MCWIPYYTPLGESMVGGANSHSTATAEWGEQLVGWSGVWSGRMKVLVAYV